jgi:predicted dehydrogenase
MKVAIVGAGGIGNVHGEAYLQVPGAQVTAVADIRMEKAQSLADKHAARAYPSLDALLEQEKPDMADVCVPSYLHKALAVQCMQHGLHVLCEKPMALSLADAQAMADCAGQNGVMFMVAQVIRFWPEYIYLKQLVDQGTYGRLVQVSFSRTCGAPLWSWENWYTDPARSGLAPFDLHVHDVDYVQYLLGRPAGVYSMAVNQPELNISHIRTRYIFNQDVFVEAEAGWYPGKVPFSAKYRAVFEGAVLDYNGETLTLYAAPSADPVKVDVALKMSMGANINLSNLGPYFSEIAYFARCQQDGVPPSVVTPQQSVDSIRLVTAEIESAKTGRVVDLHWA